jgi:hypothetical protein
VGKGVVLFLGRMKYITNKQKTSPVATGRTKCNMSSYKNNTESFSCHYWKLEKNNTFNQKKKGRPVDTV